MTATQPRTISFEEFCSSYADMQINRSSWYVGSFEKKCHQEPDTGKLP
jgi:hypothetical protein